MKATIIILTLIATIVSVGLYAMWTNESYSNNDKSITVICGVGFFYNTLNPDYRDTTKRMILAESLAKICKRNPPRTYTDAFNEDNSPKRVIQLPKEYVCIVNWELTPQAHKEAYNKECLRTYP